MATEPRQQLRVLAAFDKALRREAHNLRERPDLLWQQLCNRLQWEEAPVPQVLEPAIEERSRPGARPWLRTRTPFRESGALLGTLTGHSSAVYACAVSPDGSFIVSARSDKTLKLWDPASGRRLQRPRCECYSRRLNPGNWRTKYQARLEARLGRSIGRAPTRPVAYTLIREHELEMRPRRWIRLQA
jgi:WD40 repeat protein